MLSLAFNKVFFLTGSENAKIISKKIKFIDPPYIRFKGEDIEQETMFLEDPNGNCMEIKTMKNPNTLFKK